MKLPPLIHGTLIKRYKRFLADVELEDGSVITVHCPNTGRMTTCAEPGWRVALSDSNNPKRAEPGWRVALSDSNNPKRKYRFTWELVHNGQCWICVNTGRANAMAAEAVVNGIIPELAGYAEVLREQTFGNSRFDLLLRSGDDLCYVEVKSVTLLAGDGCYAFPDAVTERGRKHLNELMEVVRAGHRAAMLYVISRSDGTAFRVADEIDPQYAAALETALDAGVEAYAWRADVSPEELRLSVAIPLEI